MPSFSRGVAVVVLTSVALWCASVLRSSWRRSPPGSAADAHEPPAALSAIRRAITAGEGGVETAVGEAVRLILGEAGATTENPRQNFVEQRSGQADDEPALPRRHAMLLSPPPPLTPHLLRPHRRQLAHRFPVQRPNSSSHEAGAVAAVYEGSATSAGSAIERVLAGAAGSTSLRALHAKAQRLRIYVYRPPRSSSGWCATNLTAQHKKCKTFQWSGDWELIQRMRRSDQYTTDGDAADFYVVPFLSKCYYNFEAKYGLRRMDVALREVMRYLKWHSWWGARPERHLFFFLSGIGAGVVPSWRAHISRSIFIVAEGDREAPYFREGQDIVVPGKIAISRAERPLPPRKRKKLVGVFRGSLDALLRDERGARVRRKNKLRHLLFETLRGNRRYADGGHSDSPRGANEEGERHPLVTAATHPRQVHLLGSEVEALCRGDGPRAVLHHPARQHAVDAPLLRRGGARLHPGGALRPCGLPV